MRAFRVGAVSAAILLVAIAASAQAPPAGSLDAVRQEIEQLKSDFEALRAQYDSRLSALETRLATIESGQAPATAAQPGEPTAQVPAGAAGAGGPSGAIPLYGNVAAASKIFNPDIAVIGDFLGASGVNQVTPNPALEMHESEASFQAIVDPYARADFFVSFGEEGVDLEEGYVTFPVFPGGLLVKVGKMRSAFGKVNGLHNHVLPWTDRPLVTQNLLGGEEGLNDAGISAARLVPNPWVFLEATAQVFRGDSGDVFASSRRGDLSYLGHLRGYHDISDSTNIDLGVSYARGHAAFAPERSIAQLTGFDATLRWRPLRRAIYHSFIGRTEAVWSRNDFTHDRALGYYVSGDYQFARRWFAGARYDRSGRAYAASLVDRGGSVVLTYWPSEFSQIRGQYRVTNYADGPTANEFLFQFQFAIGAHGAHPF